jgi:hypothetical protein
MSAGGMGSNTPSVLEGRRLPAETPEPPNFGELAMNHYLTEGVFEACLFH